MSSVKGNMRTCDRCGEWIFLKCIGEGSADGGYTRWNEFEPAPGWDYLSNIGDLCPSCMDEHARLMDAFQKRIPMIYGETV